MTSTNSEEIKSISNTTDSENQQRREKIKSFVYPIMPQKNQLLRNNDQNIVKITTNLFELKFKDFYHNLTLYKIEVNPSFDGDNYFFKRKIHDFIEANYKNIFKRYFFAGNTLYGLLYIKDQTKKYLYKELKFKEIINKKEYEITLTKLKEVEFKQVNDFSGENQKIKLYIETIIRNIVMKNPNVIYFKDRTLFEIDINNVEQVISDNKENIYRGYMTSAIITENGLFVLINNVNKMISGKTVLEKINEIKSMNKSLSPKEIQQEIKDYFQQHKTVLTAYGVPRTYKIKDIDFDVNPKKFDITISEFNQPNNKPKTITIYNYYKTQYNIEIKESQPLIIAEPRKRKKNSEQKYKQNDQEESIIYLIPELLYITGIEDNNINKKQIIKNLGNKTKMDPDKKMGLINGFFNLYNSNNNKNIKKGTQTINLPSPKELAEEWGINLGNNLIFNGRILSPPKLIFKNNSKVKNGKEIIISDEKKVTKGLFLPGKPIRTKNLTEDNLFYLYESNEKYNSQKIFSDLCDKIISKGFKKFESKNVQGFELHKTTNWEIIEHELRGLNINGEKIVFGIIISSSNMERFYDKFKNFFLKQYNIPTQHIVIETLGSKTNERNSILFNIVDQINIKMGGMNYYINFKPENEKDEGIIGKNDKLLVIGLDSKISKEIIIYSMTSTFHSRLNLFRTQEKVVKKKIKEEKEHALEKMFKNAISELEIAPDYIILYRRGGNEYYNKGLAVDELDVFKGVLNSLREKNKLNEKCNYKNTKFYYICCNLKPDIKFFEDGQKNTKYSNPQSGLVIDEGVTQKNKFEFYLQPQYVNQGTATPSHYQVMYHDDQNNTLPMEKLQKLTYYLTYYYWNWHGAIRIPGILKFSTTALDFYTKCINPNKEIEEYKFEHPYFI